MAHIAMPSKSLQSSNSKPCYCADTGISFLIEEMCNKYNCKSQYDNQTFRWSKITIQNRFSIGPSNVNMVKQILKV